MYNERNGDLLSYRNEKCPLNVIIVKFDFCVENTWNVLDCWIVIGHRARLLTKVGQIDMQLRANNKIYKA
jgi:hypothetical protein